MKDVQEKDTVADCERELHAMRQHLAQMKIDLDAERRTRNAYNRAVEELERRCGTARNEVADLEERCLNAAVAELREKGGAA